MPLPPRGHATFVVRICTVLTLAAALALPAPARAASALIAVAANFAEAAEVIAEDFAAATNHEVTLAAGSTGKLYAQITKGAPFDALLAADQARPRRLEAEGHAVAGSRFTYAEGRLVLWSPDAAMIGPDGAATLAAGDFDHLAIANPDLAPYGLAARQTLEHMGLRTPLRDKIVMGQNIGQAFSMVATGNAALGLVAGSYVASPRNHAAGSKWAVPATYHDPIRQDAVLLAHGADNAAARAFLDYLKGADGRAVIARFGYGTGEDG
jgi:molybdate transport system substrate-binding protein